MSEQTQHRLRRILCLDDFEIAAKKHLPRPVFGYVAGAAETNWTLHDNRRAFDEFGFVPRVLIDVSKRSQQTSLFGRTYAAPFGIAPIGISALYAYRGDIVLARAAAAANVPMILSSSSLIRMEDVKNEGQTEWFQAYLPGDIPRITALVERVKRTGFEILVITVDSQVAGNRENNVRAGFSTPLRPTARLAWDGVSHPRWLLGTFLRTLLKHGMPHFENNDATQGPPIMSPNVLRDYSDRGHLNWRHFELIRELWKGTLVIKGILDVEDARIARNAGAEGIIVSNHGGRQLDGAVSALRVLPDIVAACPDIPVMMDGGVRRGTDVFKALALGAKFVFAGRPFGYAAAIGGEAGVRHAIRLLSDEIQRDLALLGIASLSELTPQRLVRLAGR
ncbi:MAG: alpha-hydroxy-acid oxidizing protein [Betaproteobacteria bacterium]|nr:alpha-hydroxy-acid oxidizing protein [Betaproteobacteria bacterium]